MVDIEIILGGTSFIVKAIISLRQNFDVSKKLYRLYGLSYALKMWIYECASQLNPAFAVKERNVIQECAFGEFCLIMQSLKCLCLAFSKSACSNIVPTTEELEAFDLVELEHAPPSSPPLVQPNDEDDFDDFSIKPPDGY
ncbi:hypothetical protein EJD97_024364 [Solanum chilense]|uniref:Uncharacterized protein n=1 Tax=Solanum chilense TaxID=4083 RepID=A0A6N2AQP3_SOLCI|nr:hypothetical protein EJD97_024364 [Solanum chilense]